MLETIGEYEEGEEYGTLPEEIIEDYPGSFIEVEEEVSPSENPFD